MLLRYARMAWAQLQNDDQLRAGITEVRTMARSAFAWLLANEVLIVLEVYPLKAFIDVLETKPFDGKKAVTVAVLIATLYVVTSIVHYLMDKRRLKFFWRLWSLMWGFGHRLEQRQSVAWHKSHSTGEKESIMTKNVSKLEFFIDDATFEAAPSILRILATATGVTIFLGWSYGVVVALTIALFLVVSWRTNATVQVERREARQAERFVERFGTEMTTNWRTLKYFGMERRRCYENQGHLDRFQTSGYSRDIKMIQGIFWQENVINLSRLALVLLIVWQFSQGATSVGSAVLAFTWMQQVYNNFYRLSAFQRRINETTEPIRELVGLLINVPEVQQPDDPQWLEAMGRVEYADVSFAYDGSDQAAIEDFNLVAEPNQTIAFVGRSGCGKSTAVELLMRSYDPTVGTILIDGVDLRALDYDRYRREIVSMVSQDVQLFDMSVRDNIRFGQPEATDDEVEAAAREAYAHGFIEAFPAGYDTLVGEDGILLSGGQKQRIAIARALLRKPRILVLDEATSSLDAESQYYVKQAIDRLIVDRICTIFVIAHRLSTIQGADWIVVLDDGRIVDSGSHHELSRRNGFYRRMCELESQGILDEH